MADADETKIVLDHLLAVTTLGTRIHADADTPPAGYTPADGPCYCFKARGGIDEDTEVIQIVSMQFKCYGDTNIAARQAYRALNDVLKTAKTYRIMSARREALGVTLNEPDTGWPYVLVYYSFMINTLQTEY